MTRFLAATLTVLALAFGACERHPLAGETEVTSTHGSGGSEAHSESAHEAKSEAKAEHKEAAHEAPKDEQHTPAKPTEESPKFFPDKQ